MELDSCLIWCTKMNSKLITDLNVKPILIRKHKSKLLESWVRQSLLKGYNTKSTREKNEQRIILIILKQKTSVLQRTPSRK